MRNWRQIWNDLKRLGTDGAAAVELAVVAPTLILMIMGAWDFGRAFQENARLESAARAGAQFGVYSIANAADTAGIVLAARTDAGDHNSELTITAAQVCECADGSSVDCSATCTGEAPRLYISVQVGEQFSTLFPYPGISNPITLSQQAEMRAQ